MKGQSDIVYVIILFSFVELISAQNLKRIHMKVEKQRQVERIKNEIMKNLESNGAQIYSKRPSGNVNVKTTSGFGEYGQGRLPTQKQSTVLVRPEIRSPTPKPVSKPVQSNPMVSIGEPTGAKKDGCLNFNVGKYVKGSPMQHIIPVRMTLWVHIRKVKNRKKNRDKKRRKGNRVDNQRIVRSSKPTGRKNRKHGKKKKKGGRKIKIFVTNGIKRLAKLRMRVRRTLWYKIELPISQFPTVISLNDTFKLCIECKRCNRRLKLDLYNNKPRRNNIKPQLNKTERIKPPTKPFIHIETSPHLPHAALARFKRSLDVMTRLKPSLDVMDRFKRSLDVMTRSKRSLDVMDRFKRSLDASNTDRRSTKRSSSQTPRENCCKESIYIEDISFSFPNIIHPKSLNISFCDNIYDSVIEDNTQPLLSQLVSNTARSHLPDGRHSTGSCQPQSMEAFTYSFVDKHYNIRYTTLPDLIPRGCRCL